MSLDKLYKNYANAYFDCVVCGGTYSEEYATKDYLTALKCKNCGMISVIPYLNDEGIELFYKNYFKNRNSESVNELNELRKKQYLCDLKFISLIRNGGSILDVGCSGGYFLSNFDSTKWDRYGTDVTKDALEEAQARFNICTYLGGLESVPEDKRFDVITMRGVLEHIRDPKPTIDKIQLLLKKGGLFCILATPVGDSFAFDIYRGKWKLFTPLEHVHFYTLSTLEKLLLPNFERIALDYPYYDTPYCNVEQDFSAMRRAVYERECLKEVKTESRSFPGSIINIIFRKK